MGTRAQETCKDEREFLSAKEKDDMVGAMSLDDSQAQIGRERIKVGTLELLGNAWIQWNIICPELELDTVFSIKGEATCANRRQRDDWRAPSEQLTQIKFYDEEGYIFSWEHMGYE